MMEKKFWVLDSSITFYTYPHKHWFLIYKQMNGTMCMSNNNSLFVGGFGNIILRMFNRVV